MRPTSLAGQEAASPETSHFFGGSEHGFQKRKNRAFCLQVIGWLGGPGGVCEFWGNPWRHSWRHPGIFNGYWESRRPIFLKLYTRRRLSPLHFFFFLKEKRRLPEARHCTQWKLDRPYKTMFYRFRCNRICQQDFPSLSWIWNGVTGPLLYTKG